MSTYCQPGNTARVTFPDGVTQDFTDTPINITCLDDFPPCTGLTVTYNVVWTDQFNRTKNDTYITGRWSKFGGLRAVPVSTITDRVEGFDQGPTASGQSCKPTQEWRFVAFLGKIQSLSVVSVVAGNTPPKKITVTGSSGDVLFSATFSDCNYQVECLEGCPPGTLDCGDCCLPCDETFNAISAMRMQVASLK
ncbi:hypothetical protein PN509_18235 [Nodularia spumigena CS-588/02]|uniref:hypothetical protein n=1 Tax=Nodularia spumigena TaxID=70799 RepID=UPI00232BB741|nr:hypothetical protein [Nodularia spumigena]MDB9362227.1 hypothetical protein [Nodularia spumigena CS-588/02]MDB9367196.1 hypothetical protein [Nodularia spumigena CS-588/02A10]